MDLKPRARCKDVDAVATILIAHVRTPSDIQYRTELGASGLDHARLTQHRTMLMELRAGPCPNGSLTEKAAVHACKTLASRKDFGALSVRLGVNSTTLT